MPPKRGTKNKDAPKGLKGKGGPIKRKKTSFHQSPLVSHTSPQPAPEKDEPATDLPQTAPDQPRTAPDCPRPGPNCPGLPQNSPKLPLSCPTLAQTSPKLPKIATNQPQTAPDQPQTAPDQPQTAPDQPQTAPDQPQTAPDQPQTAPDQPQTAPDQPQTAPDQPQTAPDQPQTAPDQPQTAPDQPQTAPDQPQTAPDQPQTAPDQPQTAPDLPFKWVYSLLRPSSGHRNHRYPVSVAELRRRTAPPESCSLNTLTALLRTDKNHRERLRQELQGIGVTPGPVTRVTSMCSKFTEEEAKDLCLSVGKQASRGIDFKKVRMLPEGDSSIAMGKAVEFKLQLHHLAKQIKEHGEEFNKLTHTLGPMMVDVVVDMISKCVDLHIGQLSTA